MPLSVQTRLMVHTAEMLALPHLVCRRRDCRRRNACHWHFSGNGEPCCLRNLTAAQRQIFNEFYQQAQIILEHGGHHGLTYTWGNPEQRALFDAGVDIARTAVPPFDKRRFDAFRRDREKIPAPLPRPPQRTE
ncbi:hypothetical protein [Rhizobium herbae]|jgi:hypothetical protein